MSPLLTVSILLAAVAFLVQGVRRWAVENRNSGGLGALVLLVQMLWWLVKAVSWLWRTTFHFVRQEISSW